MDFARWKKPTLKAASAAVRALPLLLTQHIELRCKGLYISPPSPFPDLGARGCLNQRGSNIICEQFLHNADFENLSTVLSNNSATVPAD